MDSDLEDDLGGALNPEHIDLWICGFLTNNKDNPINMDKIIRTIDETLYVSEKKSKPLTQMDHRKRKRHKEPESDTEEMADLLENYINDADNKPNILSSCNNSVDKPPDLQKTDTLPIEMTAVEGQCIHSTPVKPGKRTVKNLDSGVGLDDDLEFSDSSSENGQAIECRCGFLQPGGSDEGIFSDSAIGMSSPLQSSSGKRDSVFCTCYSGETATSVIEKVCDKLTADDPQKECHCSPVCDNSVTTNTCCGGGSSSQGLLNSTGTPTSQGDEANTVTSQSVSNHSDTTSVHGSISADQSSDTVRQSGKKSWSLIRGQGYMIKLGVLLLF